MKLTALFLAFYLFIGGCIPRSDYSQLGHLADLRAHFLEHQAEAIEVGETINFLDFLYIHFIDAEQHTDSDHEEEHQELPFQSLTVAISFLLSLDTFPDWKYSIQVLPFITSYQNPFYLNGFLDTYMRPPNQLTP